MQLFKRRCAACDATPELRKFTPDLQSWGVDIVSEDDSGGEDSGYSIRRIEWRSAEVTTFMRSLDAIYLSSRFAGGKCGRGSVPRERYPSLRQEYTVPKPRLPLNFYNEAWLEALGESKKRSLDVKEPLSLQLSEGVQQCVNFSSESDLLTITIGSRIASERDSAVILTLAVCLHV